MFKVGDKVKALDEPIEGKIVSIENQTIIVEDDDGFNYAFDPHELLYSKNLTIGKIIHKKEDLSLQKKKITKEKNPEIEIDLHIENWVTNPRTLTAHQKLEKQLFIAEKKLLEALENKVPKMIIIHGKGKGVLREKLIEILERYDELRFEDANYRKYGQGALEVTFFHRV